SWDSESQRSKRNERPYIADVRAEAVARPSLKRRIGQRSFDFRQHLRGLIFALCFTQRRTIRGHQIHGTSKRERRNSIVIWDAIGRPRLTPIGVNIHYNLLAWKRFSLIPRAAGQAG